MGGCVSPRPPPPPPALPTRGTHVPRGLVRRHDLRPTALRASSSSSQSGACCGDYKVLLLLSTPPTACASSDHQPTIFLKTSKEEKEGRKRKTQDMMGVGCNPIDLRLRLGSSSGAEEAFGKSGETQQQQQQQQITIFYDGRICSCEVTEMEARNIISMAEREMDDQMRKKNQQPSLLSPQQKTDGAELSKIRSLQQFLQNRKSRLSEIPPYNHIHTASNVLRKEEQ
ncbi:hypothetical protein OPV22_027662 [Ensete ventricosum]|uniref:Protein TIFY n=1 Tax=Ensete ventricosum TaxID=4639 RepID=A0AAV8Q895_ENSVE|nr:hypothetical protein OPV22_027662 [Ensete ventricosum]